MHHIVSGDLHSNANNQESPWQTKPKEGPKRKVHEFRPFLWILLFFLAHQNRTIAIASDFRVDWAKSPEIPQKEGVLGWEIAARNRKSLATFHRTLKSQCNIAFSCFGNRAISGACDHRNRKSQKSLRFRCAKVIFLRKTSTIHIELLFRNAPAKSSWTDLSLVWFSGATPEIMVSLADYRCRTPTFFRKNGLSHSTDRPSKGGNRRRKLASEAYRAIGGVARNSIANRAIVGH